MTFFHAFSGDAKPYTCTDFLTGEITENRLPARVFIRRKFDVSEAVAVVSKDSYRNHRGAMCESIASGSGGFVLDGSQNIIGMVFNNRLLRTHESGAEL